MYLLYVSRTSNWEFACFIWEMEHSRSRGNIEEQEGKNEKREDDVLARFWGVAVCRGGR